jgi:hypothetical protein
MGASSWHEAAKLASIIEAWCGHKPLQSEAGRPGGAPSGSDGGFRKVPLSATRPFWRG